MFLIKLLSYLPLNILYLISDFLFLLAYHIIRYRRELVMKNLNNSFPHKSLSELAIIEKQFYRNLADISVETIKALTISIVDVKKRVKIQGKQIEETMNLGRPVIIMTPHFCNWELEWVALCHHLPYEMHAVYQKLRNKFFNDFMLALRSRFGGIMHEKNTAVADMAKMGSRKYIMGMVSDQRPFSGDRKYWATFMNQDAAFYSGTEILARRLDLPVIYVSMHRVNRGFYNITFDIITTEPRLTGRNEITNTFIRLMERDISNDPASYLWSHDRWKHKKPIESN